MPSQRSIEIAVEPHEVVLGTPSIEVRAQSPLDDETAKGALALKSEPRNRLAFAGSEGRDLRTRQRAAAGPDTLVIEELVSTRGKRLSERVEVPFFVSDSRASVDRRLRVESIVRLRVERLGTVRLSAAKRPSGKFIEIMKAVDRKTGKPVELAFDQDGAKVDKDEIFDRIRQNRHAGIRQAPPDAEGGGRSRRRRRAHSRRNLVPGRRRAAARQARQGADEDGAAERAGARETHLGDGRPRRRNGQGNRAGGYEPRPDPDAPVVFAELPAKGIRRLEERDEIAAIFLHEPEGEVDLSNSMAIAQSDIVHSSLSVTGGRQRRRLRRRPGRHDQPLDHREVHQQPDDGRTTPDTRTGSSRTSRPTSRTATRRTATSTPRTTWISMRSAGRRGRGLHSHQPELPPRLGADELGPLLRRHVQGLARTALAVPDDRRGGRQRLEHGVRQPQGLQQAHRRQPR